MGGITREKHHEIADVGGIFGGNTRWTDPLGLFPEEQGPDRTAELAEKERQRKIRESVDNINRTFDAPGRKKQIADFGQALQAYYTGDLNRQNEASGRGLTFALARSGLTGGRADVDAREEHGREYQQGLAEITRRRQSEESRLRGADETARLNLTQLAQQGLGATEAGARATQAMREALAGSTADSRAQGLGDVFGSALAAKTASETRAAQRRADQQYASQYTPFYSYGGGR